MSREAMKLALEALENWLEFDPENFGEVDKKAITALQKALANEALDKMAENARELGLDYEPAQPEPVFTYDQVKAHIQAAMMSAAQRTWSGLTDEERDAMIGATDLSGAYYYDDLYAVILLAEGKLKEKNNG